MQSTWVRTVLPRSKVHSTGRLTFIHLIRALLTFFHSSGYPVGCKTACFANLDGNQANSPNCCSGQFDTPATCPASSVQYYDYFHSRCPNAYAYAYDDLVALKICPGRLAASYTLTFCP